MEKQIPSGIPSENDAVTERIRLCPDGVYRWFYSFSMLKNPAQLFTVWKVLGLSFGIVYLFVLLLELGNFRYNGWEGVLGVTWVFVIVFAVIFVISIVAYLILAAMWGGKYLALFEMRETQIVHIQMPSQYKTAQAIGWLNVMAGLIAGNAAQTGQGILAASRQSSVSDFSNVSSIRSMRKRHTIYLSEALDKNQIYVTDADFEFVLQFILAHCPKATIRQR